MNSKVSAYGTLSPEPPGIYRFPVNPAGGRPGQPRLPKPAVFESTTALGLLPSRALSSGRTPETLSPPIHLPSQGCRWSGMPESLGLSAVPYDTMRPYALSTPFHYPLLLDSSKITHSLGRRRPIYYRAGGRCQGSTWRRTIKVSAPAGSRIPIAHKAGAVGIWQVARRAGAALGRYPTANIGLFSVAPVLRAPDRQHKPRNVPGPPHVKSRSAAQ
jgi:hypothetical protein